MLYDPIKDKILPIISRYPIFRVIFYRLLDLLFLRQWYVKKIVKGLFSRNSQINFYDAGAGYCQYSDFMLTYFRASSILAVDLKTDYLESYSKYADKRYAHRFLWRSADLVEFVPDSKFNLIAAIDILEHIENDQQVLDNFYQCLENKGKLLISTPSNFDETARFTEEHVRNGYSKDEIVTKIEKSGLRVLEFCYSYGLFGRVSWRMLIRTPLTLLSKSMLFAFLLPIFYLVIYPIAVLLMLMDIHIKNKKGNGIIVIAEK